MLLSVTVRAERNQVAERIIAQSASKLQMMDLKIN